MAMNAFNTLGPRQNGRQIPDDIFKCIFLNENIWISINISVKFVAKGLIDNMAAFVQIMAWRRPGDKPLSEPMMVSLLTHICVTRPQWVNPWTQPLSHSTFSVYKATNAWLDDDLKCGLVVFSIGFHKEWRLCLISLTVLIKGPVTAAVSQNIY